MFAMLVGVSVRRVGMKARGISRNFLTEGASTWLIGGVVPQVHRVPAWSLFGRRGKVCRIVATLRI